MTNNSFVAEVTFNVKKMTFFEATITIEGNIYAKYI